MPGSELAFHRTVDLRYVGQSFTVNVPIPAAIPDPPAIGTSFHLAYEATFGHAAPAEPVELVNLRLAASLPGPRVSIRVPAQGRAMPRGARSVFFAGQHLSCQVYERAGLAPGVELSGPLVVQEPGSSTIVWPTDRLRVDPLGNLRVEVGEK